MFIAVADQGRGFDPNQIPNPLAAENLSAERGRGIHLMKVAMDEVSFEHGGTEVHMGKNWALSKEHARQHFASRHREMTSRCLAARKLSFAATWMNSRATRRSDPARPYRRLLELRPSHVRVLSEIG